MTTPTPHQARLDAEQRLAEVAALVHPCGPPDVMDGYDLCPDHPGEGWPCRSTRAAWIARGLDPGTEARSIIQRISQEASGAE